MPIFSRALEKTLRRALSLANERRHEYATLEHLLLSLIDDTDAAGVIRACEVDLPALKKNLVHYVDTELKSLIVDDGALFLVGVLIQQSHGFDEVRVFPAVREGNGEKPPRPGPVPVPGKPPPPTPIRPALPPVRSRARASSPRSRAAAS